MALQLVVKHTFWDVEGFKNNQMEFEFDSVHRRPRAFTDGCVDYDSQSVTEKSDDYDTRSDSEASEHQCGKVLSDITTVAGSSTAQSARSPTRSSAGSDSGDFLDTLSDDVMLRPAGVWLPPGTHAVWPEAMWHATPCAPTTAWGVRSRKVRPVYPEAHTSHDESTTIVVKGLSQDMPRATLLEMIDAEGFERLYDFVYLPKHFKKAKGLGYAIINFLDHTTATRAHDAFMKFASSVDWCDGMQGLDELIERYRDSPVLYEGRPEEAKPILFVNGTAVSFPSPNVTVTFGPL